MTTIINTRTGEYVEATPDLAEIYAIKCGRLEARLEMQARALREAAEFVRRYEQPIDSPARSYWLRVHDVIAMAEGRS